MITSISSHQGPRRYQEDAASLHYHTITGMSAGQLLQATVADGVGGNAGGADAANHVTSELPKKVIDYLRDCGDGIAHELVADAVKKAVVEVNLGIHRDIQSRQGLESAATTLIHGVLHLGVAIVTTIGDSSAWLYKPRKRAIEPINRLHKLVDEDVLRGGLSIEEARVDALRHMVTSALGIHGAVRIDQYARDVDAGDVLILMSDGVSDFVPEQAVGLLQQAVGGNTFSTVAKALVQSALDAGSNDNCTAVALLIEPSDIPAERSVRADELCIGWETQLHECYANKEIRHED